MVVDAAAQREGQQLLGERADEQLRAGEQRLPQAGHAVEGRRRPAGCPTRRSAAAVSSTRPPAADRVEVLQREPERIDAAMARRARPDCCDARAISSRIVCAWPPALVLLERRHIGRRRRRRHAEDVLEDPFAAAHRRGARGVRRHRQNAALPEQAAALAVLRQRDAPEPIAVDVRNAVVPGEPLVEERVVGVEQVEHAAVFLDDALEEQLGLAAERLPQVVVEVGKQPQVRARRRRDSAGTATGSAKFVVSASARGSASMRRTCCSSTAGSLQRAALGGRRAARRPGCCSTGRTTGATRARHR